MSRGMALCVDNATARIIDYYPFDARKVIRLSCVLGVHLQTTFYVLV